MPYLRYLDQNNVLRTKALGPEKFLIGRVDSCHIHIDDDLVSREHARIDRDPDGRFRIRDLGSRNKTFVNGQQISETLMSHADVVRIGNCVFEYLDDAFVEQALGLSFLTPDKTEPPGCEWIKIKQPVSLTLEQQGRLATLGADVIHPTRAEDVAEAALGRLLLLLGADRGFVALRGDAKKDLRVVAHRGLAQPPVGGVVPVSQVFLYSAVLQSVAGRYPQEAGQLDQKAGFATTALIAPLLHRGATIGVVYADRPKSNNPFTAAALQEMAAAGAHIGSLMAEATHRLAENESAVGAAWLTTLRRTQLAMTVPPETGEAFDVLVKLVSGTGRCGDFCDVIPVGDDRLYILTVDAGGQGVAGLAQANGIRTAIRSALTVEDATQDIAAIMSAVNRTFVARRARQLVMCCLLGVDLTRGQITYVNAGGPPPLLLVGPGRLVTLDQVSLVLGIDTNYAYEAATADLAPAFRLICHTDGLPEASNTGGKAFGLQNLHDSLLEKEAFAPATDIVKRLVGAFEKHRGNKPSEDDALIVVVSHG